jgi:glycosyltransferase involved in cell wall biosynthesis
MLNKIAFLTTTFPMNKQYLYDFFASLKNQTYKNFDVIVVNDGYKDFESIKVKYGKNFKIIELQYSNTPAKNREYGINYCIDNKYDVLIFGDSDDYFEENRIEKSIEFLKEYDIVVNDLSLFDETGIYEEKYISNRINNLQFIDYEYIKDKNIFGMTNTSLKLENVSSIKFDENIVAVDWYFFKKLLKQGLKAIFTNDTTSFYRQYDNNIVGLEKKNKTYYLWWEER